jgi:uncharacterized membrane protein YsdA (DUF1294 family)
MLMPYLSVLLAMTFVTAVVYSYDFAVAVGQWAIDRRPRVPEYILLLLTALGGSIGALTIIKVQRHKARKWYFKTVAYLSLLLNLFVLGLLVAMQWMGV